MKPSKHHNSELPFLSLLTEREEQAFRLRTMGGHTLKDAAGIMGVGIERVRQLELAAMRKLPSHMYLGKQEANA